MISGRRTLAAFMGATIAMVAALGAPASGDSGWQSKEQVRPRTIVAAGPSVATGVDDGGDIFFAVVLADDGRVYWTKSTGTGYTRYQSIGAPPSGAVDSPGVAGFDSFEQRRFDVFVRGGDDKLWQRFTPDAGRSWTPWFQPFTDGELASGPEVIAKDFQRLDVFVTGTDGQIYQRFWAQTSWSDAWFPLGNPPSGAAAGEPGVAGRYTRVDLFVRGADGQLWQRFWEETEWSPWLQPPGTEGMTLASSPGASSTLFRTFDVAVRGTDGGLYVTSWRDAGTWSPWERAGLSTDFILDGPAIVTSLAPFPPFTTPLVDRDVFVRGTDDRLYLLTYRA